MGGRDRSLSYLQPTRGARRLELIDEVKPLVPMTTTPTLIIQGRLDTVVEPANATWLYQNLGSSEKALINLPHSDHLVALDRERERVIQAVLEFLLVDTAKHGSVNQYLRT